MMYQLWKPLAVLSIAVGICERKWCMLRDPSKQSPRPYSWSRVQLAWWSIIILSSFIAVLWAEPQHIAPTLDYSVVILLGISAVTTTTAKVIEVSEAVSPMLQSPGENFFFDILSDNNGVSIARFQTVVFNLVFGIWFIAVVAHNLPAPPKGDISLIIPHIDNTNLALLGLSSATYAAMKTAENKDVRVQAQQSNNLASDGSVG